MRRQNNGPVESNKELGRVHTGKPMAAVVVLAR